MVAFSQFMSTYATLVNDQSKKALYASNAQSIKTELLDKLYNGNSKLYCDYAGLQWEPKMMGNGQLAEPLEWRSDSACGASFESSLKMPARCN